MNLFKQLRFKMNITQLQLARQIGVSEASISSYESGTRYPSFRILLKFNYLAKKHNVPFNLEEFS